MANITKTQVKKRVEKLVALLEDIKDQIGDLLMEVEDEVDNIEPYEGKDDLTPQQEERQEWFEEKRDTLEEQHCNLEEIISYLEEITLE